MISHSKKSCNHQPVVRGAGNDNPDAVVEASQLKDIPITTKLYTAEEVDRIISQLIVIGRKEILMPDQEDIGDYYAISMRGGRLVVVKVDGPNG